MSFYRIEYFGDEKILGEPAKAVHFKTHNTPIYSLSHGPLCGVHAGLIMWLTDDETEVTCGRCRSAMTKRLLIVDKIV
jgi:predicted nucleic acid-binding Zn ribbon protein